MLTPAKIWRAELSVHHKPGLPRGTSPRPARFASGQRVSRWGWCRLQFGQYFFSSSRSGSLRRFLRVM